MGFELHPFQHETPAFGDDAVDRLDSAFTSGRTGRGLMERKRHRKVDQQKTIVG